MATILHIAGHGKNRNGSFDPGASGFVTQGEWRYFANSFFDYLKKYEPKGHRVIYHTAYNVYSYGNIVSLARQYGSDTIVIEWHFDAAATKNAHSGHVVVYSGFAPDELDLRLRDGIKEMVGVRYNHKGNEGISGRNNLANVNRTAKNGINYRLIELGFGTSDKDSKVMLNEIDRFAEVMSEALYDIEIESTQQKDSMAGCHVVETGETLWGIAQHYGVKVAQLKEWNNLKGDLIFPGQSLEVRGADLPMPKPEPKPTSTPVAKPSNKKQGYNIAVDGYMGPDTVRVLQSYFGLVVDGEMWGQFAGNQATAAFNQRALRYGKGGSPVVKALQEKIGESPADGIWGAGTTSALQRYLGTPVDGQIWRPSTAIKELQHRLNNGTF